MIGLAAFRIKKLLIASAAMTILSNAWADSPSRSAERIGATDALLACIYPILLDSVPYTFSSNETRAVVVKACRSQIESLNGIFKNPKAGDPDKRISFEDDHERTPIVDESQRDPARQLINRSMKLYDDAALAIRKR